MPLTETELLPGFAPGALQVKEKLLDPPKPIITDSLPEVDLVPDHAPDAEQDVADVDDQVMVTDEFTSADWADEEIVTEIVGVEEPPPIGESDEPPPPPPPQDERNIKSTKYE